MSEAALYIFALFDGAALLFLSVFFIVNLSDLECDYINATTCCKRLNNVRRIPVASLCCLLVSPIHYFYNWAGEAFLPSSTMCGALQWIIPELAAHGLITVLLLLYFQWIFFLLNVPLASWHVYRYINKPPGDVGLYDPAEIHNRSLLKFFLKESMVKLGFHLVFFFLYLYSMIAALLASDGKSI